ncbi:MAG: efflux RND transporter permease subunit [Myxococcota bacterium]|nr:efflux RND transporter permease subunit [Myxococcota bacterium]
MNWAKWLVDHSTTVAVAVVGVLIAGIVSYMSLPREAAPDIPIPVVVVSTIYPGVSPEDIETLVTVPMERKLKDLKDVDKLSSTSYEGASSVVLEFDPDIDIDEALPKVREKVDAAKADIPEDTEDPVVQEVSFSDIPILIVTMTGTNPDGSNMDEERLKDLAEDLKDEIEGQVPGVLEVKLSGGLTREISVQLNPDRMRMYNLSFGEVMGALSAENVNVPGGNVDAREADYLLRVPGEFQTAEDIEAVPIKNQGGETVFVRDVGRVVDGYADRATFSRMNGTPSISLSVQKRTGENIVDIAKGTMATVEAESANWPEGVQYAFIADQSREIEAMVSELENNIITGLLLVVGVLLFFMGFRNSLFVGLAIPLSMLLSFIVLSAMGITLNMVVLFSLILALGMLVDNAIVIVENIYRHVELGKSLREASIIGVSEVALPVATSTLTTVAAFAPLIFWSGIMGKFMGYLPKTLIIVLTSSLIVAVFVIPAATAALMKATKLEEGQVPSEEAIPETGLYGWVMKRYKGLLEWSIDHRYLSFFGLGMSSFVATFVIYGMFNHGTEFFPSTEPARAFVQITMPDGTRIEKTDQIARQIEAILAQEPDVDTYVTEVGVAGGGGGGLSMGSSVPHAARLTIDFKPSESKAREGEEVRAGLSSEAIARIRSVSAQATGAKIVVDKEEMGPPTGKPIEVQITGEDFHVLGQVSEELQRELAKLSSEPGADPRSSWSIVDIQDDYKVGRPELRLEVDRAAAKKVGTNTASVANTVRTAVAGTKASTLRDGDEEYDIVVEMADAYKQDIPSILDLRVPGKDNMMVPLSTLASFETRGGSGAIKHLEREKVVTISAEVQGAREDLAQAAVAAFIADYDAPEGVQLGMGGSNEEQQEAAEFLMKAFGIAVLLIFLVLVTQFNSLTRPFIIMMSVMLSLIGVLWGLLLTGTPFGIMMTGVGVISLAGVVVNNAIVLLDYVDQCQKEGMALKDAVVRAGLVRFRPVILTAITTILGLFPMATGISFDFTKFKLITGGESADFWGPMAVSVSFGLAVATVLTLVMVPTMVALSEDFTNFFKRLVGRKSESSESPTPVTPSVAKVLPWLLVPAGLALSVPAEAQGLVTLDDAIAAAEGSNLDLKIMEEQAFQAQTAVPMAWSTLTPRVVGGANWTRNQQEIELDMSEMIFRPSTLEPIFLATTTDPTEQAITEAVFDEVEAEEQAALDDAEPLVIQQLSYFDYNVSVVQPLFNPVAFSGLRGAYAQREQVNQQISYARSQLLVGVTQAYYGLVVARESYAIATDSVANARDHLSIARRQVDAGAAPPIVGLQAELALARAERQLLETEARILSAEQAFAKLTGLPADSLVEMPGPIAAPVDSLDQAMAAVESRPDVLAADKAMEVATYRKRADQLGWLPTVDSRFTYSWTENTGFQGQNEFWMFQVSANWTLWDGGYRLQTNRQYASQLRVADYEAQKARLDASEDIRLAWQNWEQAATAFAAVEMELSLATENLRLSEQAFAAGAGTWLEVSDAQLMLDQARIGLLNQRMARDMAALQLALVTGQYQP